MVLVAVIRCPRDGEMLRRFFVAGLAGGVSVESCTSCLGMWVDDEEVTRLLGRRHAAELGRTAPEGDSRIACPRCRVGLKSLVYRGIVVDVCVLCGGVWFDEGEAGLAEKRSGL